MTTSLHLWLLPLLPLAGFVLNGSLGRRLSKTWVTAIALVFSGAAFAQVLWIAAQFRSLTLPHVERFATPWIGIRGFQVDFSFLLDPLTLVMLLVVTGVGFLIHLYSVGYMAEEDGYWRFFGYLNLFLFFMLTLVLAENFLLLFVGWEGVGLASYLLIGFYYGKDSAAAAGKKAFIVNRIGDFGFLLAMFLVIAHFGTLSFTSVFGAIAAHPQWNSGVLTAIALLLVLGATGKSAQIPLYIWLPDAMEGPTPVSALIHAATMVTAGIYMVARAHVLFDCSPVALGVVAVIGAATAFFAATVGIVQNDIKRVLAYSTISQLGYMFLACGVAAYSAAVFHLVTHAFFKALLFLAAGSVIHALGGEQDMRVMGGLRKKIPITFWTMTAAVFAISGFFPFSGFFSKDAILAAVFNAPLFDSPNGGKVLWVVGVVTVALTSFYMFRLWYLTFFGSARYHEEHAGHGGHGVHEGSWTMLVPLIVLGILSLAGGWMGWPALLGGHDWFAHFLDPVFASSVTAPVTIANASSSTEWMLTGLSLALALTGWFLADTFYRRNPKLAEQAAKKMPALYKLLLHKYWIDEIYGAVIVTPLLAISRFALWKVVEGGLIDGSGVAMADGAAELSTGVRRMQSGNIRSYAGWLAMGAALVLILVAYLAHWI
ncbi:MAG TPA: NADH-quinone oxidoreductase subunit L [Acidobacteriaceae bacterium]|jgi:NADH-quinone oxidoreductase subunit L|nr:NADH-quinone oxidoreductase subunit L [Acidobacteriaceae bacterium]